MKPIISILLVEDHLIARIGISSIINVQPDMIVVAEAVNAEQGVEMFRRHQPDITLMDLRLGETNGADAVKKILKDFPKARIIILSSHSGDAEIARALELGVCGYVIKDVLEDDLINAIRLVYQGKKHIPLKVAQILSEHFGQETLTPSEQKILELIVEGAKNKTIADKLFISENTVKSHVKNIFGKLGVNERGQAVAIALKRGFVNFEE